MALTTFFQVSPEPTPRAVPLTSALRGQCVFLLMLPSKATTLRNQGRRHQVNAAKSRGTDELTVSHNKRLKIDVIYQPVVVDV